MIKNILFFIFLLVNSHLIASSYTVHIRGSITDTTGNPVPGANVEITAKTFWGSLIYANITTTDRLGGFSDSFITDVPGFIKITASDTSFGTVDTLMAFSIMHPSVSAQIKVIRGLDPCVASFNWFNDPAVSGKVEFTNTSTGNYDRIVYDFGDGTFDSTANPIHYFDPGNHEVCLTISSPTGCFDKRCETISIADPVTCEVAFTYSQTSGLEIEFQATTTSSLSTEFTWFLGDGMQASGKNVTHNFNAPGIYTITVQAVDLSGCEDTHTGQIQVSEVIQPCKAAFRYIPDPQNPQLFHFTDASTGEIATWSWEFGDGNQSDLTNPHNLYQQNGQYKVMLKIGNQDTGCNDSVSTLIDVGLGYYFNLAGQIFAGGFPADSSEVEVYRLNNGLPVFAGSFTSGPYGIFHFYALTQGIYILKAGLKITSPDYGKYLTTYYRNVAFWEDAQTFNLTTDSTTLDFHLIPNPTMLDGPGSINGHIYYQLSGNMRSDVPAGYMPILLFNQGREPIHGVYSLEDGYFEFLDVPTGDWKLQPEITGLTIDPYEIQISTQNQNQSNLVVKVIESGVTFGIGINDQQTVVKTDLLYPNPARECWHLSVESDASTNVTIMVYSSDSRLVATYNKPVSTGSNDFTFTSGQLTRGAYYVIVQNNNSIISTHKLFLE
ncbi:MAG TPA: hypothetical protein DCR43_09845 [Bacteroidales bacterium]|nr:MAG: hypothetical protein A2X11_03570 [Bacteroidetes bacterium GWE2_42_24]OFY32697.1 MAG: hypothetical protein A2X09_06550 [Bacteroidetes bacterium GWF2_43_11]PKP27225.1 MAG: hypothetical protein CVU06_02955 [Bacteroidetes bacterium HGW-Bacteroidetes-22]HAQ66137.1 hypothetical protein [Bacteroidales bacterium]HBZ65221.1 hypothetical protein [Bacteroidales bacterium]